MIYGSLIVIYVAIWCSCGVLDTVWNNIVMYSLWVNPMLLGLVDLCRTWVHEAISILNCWGSDMGSWGKMWSSSNVGKFSIEVMVLVGELSLRLDFKWCLSAVSAGFSSGSKNRGSSNRQPNSFNSAESASGEVYGSLNFTLQDIKKATKNFSQNNILGDGGFGTVYKGQLKDGTLVAIKRAKKVILWALMISR